MKITSFFGVIFNNIKYGTHYLLIRMIQKEGTTNDLII